MGEVGPLRSLHREARAPFVRTWVVAEADELVGHLSELLEEALSRLAGLMALGGIEDAGCRLLPRIDCALAHRRQRPQCLCTTHFHNFVMF